MFRKDPEGPRDGCWGFLLHLHVPSSLPAASTASGSLNSGLWVQVGVVAAHVLAVVVGRDRRQRAQAAVGLRHIPCGVTVVHACRPVPSKHHCDFCLVFWLMRRVTRCSLLSGLQRRDSVRRTFLCRAAFQTRPLGAFTLGNCSASTLVCLCPGPCLAAGLVQTS